MNRLKTRCIHSIAGLLIGSVASYAASDDGVVEQMGGISIKTSYMKDLLRTQSSAVAKSDPRSGQEIDQLVRTEAIRQALVAEALAKNWDERPEVVALMDLAQDQVLVRSYINDRVRPSANYPADDNIKQAYESNKTGFATPRQFRIAQIYLAESNNGKEDEKHKDTGEQARDIAAKAKEKRSDFAELAKKHSAHTASATSGGDMGWLPETQIVAEIRKAVIDMKKGEVSDPIKLAHRQIARSKSRLDPSADRGARRDRKRATTAQGARSRKRISTSADRKNTPYYRSRRVGELARVLEIMDELLIRPTDIASPPGPSGILAVIGPVQ